MTTIFSVVDASIQLAQQDQSRPPPTQDFAHELAKSPSQAKQPTQGSGKATANGEFDQQQVFEPTKAGTGSVADEPLPPAKMLVATAQQMEAAEPVTVASTGVTETLLEARVFGWHAMAQAYLSELTAAEGHVDQSDTWQGAQDFAATQRGIVSEAPESVIAAPVMEEESIGAPQVEALAKVEQSITREDAAPVNAIESASTDAAASGFWPERSLRFTRQRDGSSVAWLRDFRLSDTEASHLIHVVLHDAKEKGVALSRIMLNGREVWTSPNVI